MTLKSDDRYTDNTELTFTWATRMKTYKFEPYFTGAPLVRVEFSYNETTMFRKLGEELAFSDITEEQLSDLNSLHADEQMRAASVFGDAYGPERGGCIR